MTKRSYWIEVKPGDPLYEKAAFEAEELRTTYTRLIAEGAQPVTAKEE